MKKVVFLLTIGCQFALVNCPAYAQFTILHTFNGIAGQYPAGTLTLSGKMLYGMTSAGGKDSAGCIFSIDTNGNNFKDIYDFGGAGNGAFPFGGSLKLAGNKLYGMTSGGGANDSGCVFSIDTNGNGYADLLDFNGTNGASPQGSLVLAGAKIFGMTYGGGTGHLGVVFTIDVLGHNYKNLYDFNGDSTGANPYGDITVVNDKLLGMTSAGGIYEYGNIFYIDSTGGGYINLYDFTGGPDGAYPNNILTQAGNDFFGMTYSGGAGSNGNVFVLNTQESYIADLLDFAGTSAPFGQYPYADVVFSKGVLYGTTSAGGANDSGCVFSVDTNGGNYTDLYDFAGTSNGDAPLGNVIVSGKNLYGTAYTGGSTDDGIIFKIKDTATTGIDELKGKSEMVKVYPNPSSGVFILQAKSEEVRGKSIIEVYNVLGEQVYSHYQITKSSNYQIDLSSQPSGVYLYRIITETGNLIGEGKLVIQR